MTAPTSSTSFRRLIGSAPPIANRLALFSGVVLLVKVILLNRLPTPVPFFQELGGVFEAVLASIVASYIFYILVVHLPELRERDLVEPYILSHARSIVKRFEGDLSELTRATGQDWIARSRSEVDLHDLLKSLDPNGLAPLQIGRAQANWLQYFGLRTAESSIHFRKIFAQARFVPAELLVRLTRVDDSPISSIISTISSGGFQTGDLGWLSSFYFEYCDSCWELKKYLDLHERGGAPLPSPITFDCPERHSAAHDVVGEDERDSVERARI